MNRLNNIWISPHFKLSEFEDPNTHEVVIHEDLLLLMNAIRINIGATQITSGYRTQNTHYDIYAKRGKLDVMPKKPYHMRGMAADFIFPKLPHGRPVDMTYEDLQWRLVSIMDNVLGKKRGGIYHINGRGAFHVDVRETGRWIGTEEYARKLGGWKA